ncbi:RidA family protein [Auraticoccus monumenti]|uniref:Enamine deaminase RidA, house cleaning of reactive enamine intermediates, YjgF/YER057c/UK114 family n=1 Tax=Auraticoccus monumenti TaxID=675864 RepID=A0A1G6ZQ65_9ACTN|nr:RidA family protein [Auraticoccus monumenti]SDE04700.1 Enamine deaminase RidA, house cleaning of reactive enamine intermediates, YjgF/YER057c/UK114 family [Auraticoccus monumenti]
MLLSGSDPSPHADVRSDELPHTQENPMTVHLSHPDGLLEQTDYAPVAVATGSRLVLLAGQAGVTAGGQPSSADLAGQVHSALHNVVTGVVGAGGTVDDIARLTIYVVGWTEEMAPPLFEGLSRAQASDGYSSPLPPITVIGVQALWAPQFLVEIEATAVLA